MSKKEERQILKNNGSVESDEYKKLLIIIAIIASVFLVFYLATVLFTKKDDSDNIFKNDLDASEIQYDEIIIGTMFNQNSDSYYVLLLEEDEQYKSLYDSYITTIRDNKDKIYTVDLTNAFNKEYVSDKSSYNKDNFKVKGTTLIKIEKSKITKSYEDKEKIADILYDLTKGE